MAGKRDQIGTYVTLRKNYREDISAAEAAADVVNPAIPEIDTRAVQVNPSSDDRNIHGKDARLFLSVLLSSGISGATVQTWMFADIESVPGGATSSSSSLSPSEGWVLVQSDDLTSSKLVKVLDVPPARYKVLVTSITGVGTINILSQYAG